MAFNNWNIPFIFSRGQQPIEVLDTFSHFKYLNIWMWTIRITSSFVQSSTVNSTPYTPCWTETTIIMAITAATVNPRRAIFRIIFFIRIFFENYWRLNLALQLYHHKNFQTNKFWALYCERVPSRLSCSSNPLLS